MSQTDSNSTRAYLVFAGDRSEYQKIHTLFKSGKLDALLDVKVLQVGLMPEAATSQPPSSSISQWLQSSLLTDGWKAASGTLRTFLDNQTQSTFAYRDQSQFMVKAIEQLMEEQPDISRLEIMLEQAQSEQTRLFVAKNIILLDPENRVAADTLIQLLASPHGSTRRNAAFYLGQSIFEEQDVINTLVEQIHIEEVRRTEETCETRWQMAISLGQLVPEHPAAAIAQTKTLQLANFQLALMVAAQSSSTQSNRINIFLQVKIDQEDSIELPNGLTLTILDSHGNKVLINPSSSDYLETAAHPGDYCLCLELYGTSGEEFLVNLSHLENNVTEMFII